MTAAREAPIYARIGAPRSGKSASIKLDLAREQPARLLVWDPKREYLDYQEAGTLAKLYALTAGKSWRLRYVPRGSLAQWRAQFDAWCKIALERTHCTMVADELADVTMPGWAPEGWQVATRQSAHSHLTIYGATQRPATVDKSFFANASHLRCFRLGGLSDIATMADAMMIDKGAIRALSGTRYIELERATGKRTEGELFPAAQPSRPRARRTAKP